MTTTTHAPKRIAIALHPVQSSQIHSAGYSPEHKTLALVFKNKSGLSAEYQYPNVSQEQYDAFKGAESLGSHFGKHIKHLPFHKFDRA